MKKLITTIFFIFTAFLMSSSNFAQVTGHKYNYTVNNARNSDYNGNYYPNSTYTTPSPFTPSTLLRWKHESRDIFIYYGDFHLQSGPIKIAVISTTAEYDGSAVGFTDSIIEGAPDEEPLPSSGWKYNNNSSYADDPITVSINGDPLPVELVAFSASIDGNSVNLTWMTATEVNNYGFEVEKLGASAKWEKIGFVEGKGNTNAIQNYKFQDNNVSGKVRYRLKQIDIDGKFEYSKDVYVELVVAVAVEVIEKNEFALEQNFPNPFNPSTLINYHLLMHSFVNLRVYDILGSEVATLVNEQKPAGNYEVKFDASNLSSGVYLYILQAGEYNKTMKMILMK